MDEASLSGDTPAVSSWPQEIPALALKTIAQGGEAVGRYRGRAVFVWGGLPGEVVAVRLTQVRRTYARGVVSQVLQAVAGRVAPRCPLFGRCGGCQWQYIAYPRQLEFKAAIVADQCRRLGGLSDPPVAPTIGMDLPWAYRTRATFHLSPEGEIGYYARQSHQVVPLEECPLLVSEINRLLPSLRRSLAALALADRPSGVTVRYSWAQDRLLLLIHQGTLSGARRLHELFGGEVARVVWEKGRPAGRGGMEERLGGVLLRVSATSFFQVNIPQAERLLETVEDMLAPTSSDHLLDAYAGVGALSLPLLERVASLVAVESHPAAVRDLQENARRLQPEKVTALRGRVEEVLPTLQRPVDLALLDPPRRGAHQAIPALLQARPRRIVYVSCHPGTLARDLRVLCAGGYRVVRIQPIDLFPQTFHVESVTLLVGPSG